MDISELNSSNGNKSIYIIRKCWLVGDHLLLRNFGPYGIIIFRVGAENNSPTVPLSVVRSD
jgi:hypothetical protein